MKTSTILKEAKKHLDKTLYDGICCAVERVSEATGGECHRVKEIVMDRIFPFAYAHQWLSWRMLFPNTPTNKLSELQWDRIYSWRNTQGPVAIQAWRLRWMDKLIAEFEKKGD